jgi:hypothetical protein
MWSTEGGSTGRQHEEVRVASTRDTVNMPQFLNSKILNKRRERLIVSFSQEQ